MNQPIRQLYTFFRAEGFYPLELSSEDHPDKTHPDLHIPDHVKSNPGTLKVVNEVTGQILFESTE